MSLAERAQSQPDRIHGSDCSVGILLRTLEGPELSAFLTMLGTDDEPGWSQSEIFQALKAEGHSVGQQTINRHRGRKCRCFR